MVRERRKKKRGTEGEIKKEIEMFVCLSGNSNQHFSRFGRDQHGEYIYLRRYYACIFIL